ncbi:hypothetical protein [Sulfuricurvum sp.]|uniref:hypothetical protein n=1 Tax=Sulfuricurvum sp. TaxID=2025608 RepID=UPI0026159E2E|nr:hypothetical protein [Sulfuricurvum sp.]MDD2267447.1 hypothetical protein [Sulfuricurvum sp.]MDD2782831.1 hypothetical protein [Sulfuricurvum sp.]
MLHKATVSDLDALLSDWSESTLPYGDEGTVYANDLYEKVGALKKSIAEPDNHAYIFKLVDGRSRALLSIIHAMPRSSAPWIKLLDLDLHPDLVLGDFNHDDVAVALGSSIFDSMALLFADYAMAKELKIYGRTESMIKTFDRLVKNKALMDILAETDIICSRNKHWLYFRKITPLQK